MLTYQYGAAGIALTKQFEGLRLTAYQDVAGVWTIGYGHTGPDVHEGLTITQARADELLLQDLAEAVHCVNAHVTIQISQDRFDALVDFAFNCGRGNFLSSTLLRNVNAGEFAAAAAQFGLWVHAGGQVVEGLVRRRKVEADLFAGAAIAWACGTCAAQPGEICVALPAGTYHAARIEAAAAHSGQPGTTPTTAQFDAAVSQSGLV